MLFFFFVLALHNSGVGCFSFVINGLVVGNSHHNSGDVVWPAAFVSREERSEGCNSGLLRFARSSSCRFNCEFGSARLCTQIGELFAWIQLADRWRLGGSLQKTLNWKLRSCFALQKGSVCGVQRSNPKSVTFSWNVSRRQIVLRLWLLITDVASGYKNGWCFHTHTCSSNSLIKNPV